MQRVLSFKIIPPLEKYPQVVSFVQTLLGKTCLLACFQLFLFLVKPYAWLPTSMALAFFTFFPGKRKYILLVATLSWALLGYTPFYWDHLANIARGSGISSFLINTPGAVLAVFLTLCFCALCVRLAGKSPLAPTIKRPVFLLILFFVLATCAASYLPLPAAVKALLWIFIIILSRYFWFLAYTLSQCKGDRAPGFMGQLGHYLPFWAPSNIPYPKGAAYLKRVEAKDSYSLAISQLKGLKLIVWAYLLSVFGAVTSVFIYGSGDYSLIPGFLRIHPDVVGINFYFKEELLFQVFNLPFDFNIPRYWDAFAQCIAGTPLPWHTNWTAVIINFLYLILEITIMGHTIIAVCRFCGYNALRNTYRPLTSPSIAEFWNRSFYYYKELLVEFFFYPTFFRYFKKRPLLRMYAATLAAACFGNVLYHFFKDANYIMNLGFFEALAAFHTFIFYAFILGTAIFVSQWRQEKNKKKEPHPLSRFLSPMAVIVFYSVLSIFADHRREAITQNFKFFFALFNVSLG